MITYKTFNETVNDNPIKDQSDETVQKAVYDWFKYRYIGFEDTAKFLDILQRNVSINYPIYQQKLRIEPGVSSYDWLVSDYRERQLKSKGTSTGSTTYGGKITTSNTGNSTDVRTGSQTDTKNATGTDTRTGNETSTDTGTDTNIKSGNEDTVRTGTDTHIKTGGHTQTDTAGLHTTTTSPHVKVVTSEDGGDSAWSGDTQVQANLPLSKSYDNAIAPGTEEGNKYYFEKAYDGIPATSGTDNLNWETVSAQAQSGHREYHDTDHKSTQSYVYDDGVTGDIQTTKGDSTDPDKHDTVYNNETDTQTLDTKDAHTYNNVTDTRTLDTLNTHTYNDVKDSHASDSTDILTYNSVTDTHTSTGNGAEEHTGTDTTEDTDDRTDREQVTGRNEDPATLLARATAFIEQSSAFMWLKEQIDSCFYPGFYTDDEEGSANI